MKYREKKWAKDILRRMTATSLVAAMSLSMAVTSYATVLEEIPSDPSTNKPVVTVEGNAVVDSSGNYTGYFELAVKVRTEFLFDEFGNPAVDDVVVDEDKTITSLFDSVSVAINYDANILTPVTWDYIEDPAAPGIPVLGDVVDVTSATMRNPVFIDTKKPDQVLTAGAQVEYYDDLDPESTVATLVMWAEAPEEGVTFSQETEVVVVRFKYDMDTAAEMSETDAFAFLNPFGAPATPEVSGTDPDKESVVWFAEDEMAAFTSAGQSVMYTSNETSTTYFYYYLNAEDDLDSSATVPNTVGSVVLTNDNYTDNLLTVSTGADTSGDVVFRLVNRLSYDDSGVNLDDIVTILYYDWDNVLIGVQNVARGDTRSLVNSFVETNFIHPELRASSTSTDMDSLARVDTYRGEYNSTAPGVGATYPDGSVDSEENSTAGSDYVLTNKLDYSFYKYPTARVAIDADGNPDDEGEYIQWIPHTVNDVTPIENYTAGAFEPIDESASEFPYVNGWAIIDDVRDIENTWTTFGVGELASSAPNDGLFDTADVNSYFELADFANIDNLPADQRVLYVKACYTQGDSLEYNMEYTPSVDEAYYVRYGAATVFTGGGVYAIQMGYNRVTTNGYGAVRMREPALRVQYTTDKGGYPDTVFFTEATIANVDSALTEFTPSSAIMSAQYNLVDKKAYSDAMDKVVQLNFANGVVRSGSTNSNELDVDINFDYTMAENLDDGTGHLGTYGFVTIATVNQLLQYAAQVNSGLIDYSDFNGLLSMDAFLDANWRGDTDGSYIGIAGINNVIQSVYDAIVIEINAGRLDENGYLADGVDIVDIWHDIQRHMLFGDLGAQVGGDTSGYSWCRMCNCGTDAAEAVNTLDELLEAAYKVSTGAQSNALNLLASDFYFRKSIKGVSYDDASSFDEFKTAIVDMVGNLIAGGASEGDITSLTWSQVQYRLEYLGTSIPDQATADAQDYWWEDGGTKVFEDLAEVVQVADWVVNSGYHDSWLTNMTAADIQSWLIRATDTGGEYSSNPLFILNLKSAISDGLLGHLPDPADSRYDSDTDGKIYQQDVALVVQHMVLGNPYMSAVDIRADEDISYWWIVPPVIETWQDMVEVAWMVYVEDKGEGLLESIRDFGIDAINGVTGEPNDDHFFYRTNTDGGTYTDVEAFITRLEIAINKISAGGVTDWTEISWEELQNALILMNAYEDLAEDSYLDADVNFWWKYGGTLTVGIDDWDSFVSAVWEAFKSSPTDMSVLSDLDGRLNEINGAEGEGMYGVGAGSYYLLFRKDTDGTPFSSEQEFYDMIESNIASFASASESNFFTYLSADVSGWENFQYALINATSFAVTSAGDKSAYWWYEYDTKPDTGSNLSPMEWADQKLSDVYDSFWANGGSIDPLTDAEVAGLNFSLDGATPMSTADVNNWLNGALWDFAAANNWVGVVPTWDMVQFSMIMGYSELDSAYASTMMDGFRSVWYPIGLSTYSLTILSDELVLEDELDLEVGQDLELDLEETPELDLEETPDLELDEDPMPDLDAEPEQNDEMEEILPDREEDDYVLSYDAVVLPEPDLFNN